jgi:hypothetical protein
MDRAKIPATVGDDESLMSMIADRYGDRRWMFIPNTLHLESLYVSEDLREELLQNPKCRVADHPVPLTFRDGRHQLSFASE